jgi:ParB family chromosome partitioning protein
MPEILYCDVDQLEHDPDNPRRLYLDEDLHRLAETIYLNGGVDQALLVRPSGRLEDGRRRYLVVDGNYRLAAARTLGHKAPRLKCEVLRSMSRKRKLLIMGRTSEQHYPRDPISEAIYYRKLIEEEEISRIALSRNIGCSTAKIANRLSLLELDEEIQGLVAEKKLPKDSRIVKAFMGIPSKEKRIQLARELVRRNASIKAIIIACSRLRRRLDDQRTLQAAFELVQDGLPECVAIALSCPPSQPPDNASKCKWSDVRQKVK